MTNLDAQIIYTNIIQFQVDPALTETILADLAGSNGPVDFERLFPLPPLPDQNPISLPELMETSWGSQTNALNSRIERLGDTTKLIFDTGGSPPYIFICVLARRYKIRFVFKYFNPRLDDWGIEIWQDDGCRVSDRIDSHMLREQLQMEIRGEKFPESGVEWRPTPPSGFIRVETTGHLANCPVCQDSSLLFKNYNTFQDPFALEQNIRIDRADREWIQAFERAIQESGDAFDFAQFWAEHGPSPDINDSRFSVDGVVLADHWSRCCDGTCLKCHSVIWHDFVGDNWHYYYYHPSYFATRKEGDAARQVGSDKGKSVFTPPNLLRQITFEKVFRLSTRGSNKHLNGSGGYYNGQATAGVKYPIWPSVRRTFDNWYQGIKRRLPTPVGLFDKQPSPPLSAVDIEEMTYTPLEVAVEQILPYLPRQFHSSSVIVPFAGEGWMAYMVRQWNGWPICVEASPSKAAALHKKGYGTVVREDFRTWSPFVRSSEDLAHGIRLGQMARERGVWRSLYGMFMFPPLEGGSDVRCVMHALPFQQEPGTVLVAIMHETSFSGEHTPALAFRAWLNGLQGWSVTSQPLPSGTIKRKEDGVNIPVRLVTFTKEADEQATGSREEEIVR